MKPPLDPSRIAKALEEAGMEPGEARAAAARLRARTAPKQPSYLLDSTSRKLRDELVQAIAEAGQRIEDAEERIAENNRRHMNAMKRQTDAIEFRLRQHLDDHERRRNRRDRIVLAALAALLAGAIAALEYLN